jgi:alpha-1,2-mannosyltransferase
MVVVIFAILGPDPLRDRRRLWAAGAVTGFFLCRMPWWGIIWLSHPELASWPGRILQNADTFGSLGALALLWWALHLEPPLPDASAEDASGELTGEATGEAPVRGLRSAAAG